MACAAASEPAFFSWHAALSGVLWSTRGVSRVSHALRQARTC